MPNYQQSKIYKIWSQKTDDIYIGSTTQKTLARRMSHHRCCFKRWKSGKERCVTAYHIMNHGDARIELIENFPCNSKDELHAREGQIIRQHDCVNKRVEGRGQKQREFETGRRAEYRKTHKKKIQVVNKKYYKNNKSKLKKDSKTYRQNNNQTLECPCSGTYKKYDQSKHNKTRMHTIWLSIIQ